MAFWVAGGLPEWLPIGWLQTRPHACRLCAIGEHAHAPDPQQSPPAAQPVTAPAAASPVRAALAALRRSSGNAATARMFSAAPPRAPAGALQRAMVLPIPPPQALSGYVHNAGNNATYVGSGTFNDIDGTAKERAGTVEATVGPADWGTGSQPFARPLGWDYVAQVQVPTKKKGHTKGHSGWVRFHLLNENLSGSGREIRNLVPVQTIYNTGGQWTSFEQTAKSAVWAGASSRSRSR